MTTRFPTFRRLASTRIAVPLVRPWYTSAQQRRALLRLIAVGIEEKLPLAPLIAAWAEDERGPQKYRLHRLVRLLDSGTPLIDALEQVPGVLRDEDILALRFDSQSGTLTAAVRESLEDSQRILAQPRTSRNTLFYFCVVLLFAVPVVTFTQIKIVPKLNKIYEEFDLEVPQPLQWSVRFTELIVAYWWLIALGMLVLLWSAFSAWPGRFVRRSILGRFFQPLRELHAADVLRKIGIAMNAGRPLTGALSTLARYHFDPTTRHKLLFVRNEVEQGADVWQSLSAVDMLTEPEVRVLETAERVGNRPWALKQLAAVKNRRTMHWLDRMADLLLPAVVIVMGAFVLLQGLSMFTLLTQLVHSLA